MRILIGKTTTNFNPRSLAQTLGKKGFTYLLWRGIFAVLVGIMFLVWPFDSATVFGILVGAWMIVDGLATCGMAFDQRKAGIPWGWKLAEGIISVIAGLLIVIFPASFAVVSSFFILGFLAFGLIFQGIVQMTTPKPLRSGWLIVNGIINVIFGLILGFLAILNPVDSVFSLAWMAGLTITVIGAYMIWFAFKVRKLSV